MFGTGNDPFGPWDEQQGLDTGDELVGRIMSTEANLAMQRGDQPQAMGALGQFFGYWLNRKLGQ